MTAEFKIASIRPVSRNAVDLLDAKGVRRQTRVYSGLVNRKTPLGAFEPIDETSTVQLISAKGVPTLLRDKTSVCTVGLRSDGQTTKAVGFRPDDDQSGKIQFEVSAPVVTFDGREAGVPISAVSARDARTSDLGAFLVQARRQGTRIMVPATNAIRDFRIEFRFDLTGCYIEERSGEYWVFKDGGEFWFRIRQPQVIDPATGFPVLVGKEDEQDPLQGQIQHSLTANTDGTWTYAKTPGKDFNPSLWPAIAWLDVDTVYSTAEDAYIGSFNHASWVAAHGATSGTEYAGFDKGDYTNRVVWNDATPSYGIVRSFFFFDVAAFSGQTAASATVGVYGYGVNHSSCSLQLSTAGSTLDGGDFEEFSGSEYDSVSPWSKTAYNIFTLNEQGIIDLQAALGGTFTLCLRERSYDYLNIEPTGSGDVRNGCYFSEQAGTDKDPYLEITWAAGGGSAIVAYYQNVILRNRRASWLY